MACHWNGNPIGMANWLFASQRRIGQLRPSDLSPEMRKRLKEIGSVEIVDSRVKVGGIGHSYFHSSPAVSSDLILALRYGALPGTDRRPLGKAVMGFWVIDDENYPFLDKE